MNDNFLNKDSTKKIVSVLLALLLWFYVITEQNPDITKDITIPVRLVNSAFLENSNMVIVNDPSGFKLTLKLKGKNKVLDKLNESTVEAYADMEGHRLKGDNFLDIKINGVPEDVNILQKSSESLKIVLEPKVSIQKSVQVNMTGNPSLGMAAMKPSVVPNDVIIMGAESLIQKISSVRVDVDIAGAAGATKKILPVRVLDGDGKDIKGITVDPGNVEVSIPIENTKLVKLEADLSGQPAEGYMVKNITLGPTELMITGKPEIIAGINSIKTEKIDISDATADVSRETDLVLPAGVELTSSAAKVSVMVDIEKITVTEITIGNFEYRNIPDGMELDGTQGEVVVAVKGAESSVSNAATDIKFYVDLKDATEGSNAVNVSWEAPSGLEVQSILPHQVVVVLKKVIP